MREIPLPKGYVAIVDDEDYELVAGLSWNVRITPYTQYAQRSIKLDNGTWSSVQMHRTILNAPKGVLVDHADGNGLNNTKENLRLATWSDNMRNRRKASNNTSGYIGVSWHKPSGKWWANVAVAGRKISGGYHDDPMSAAIARDVVALREHGDFAFLNFPEGGPM